MKKIKLASICLMYALLVVPVIYKMDWNPREEPALLFYNYFLLMIKAIESLIHLNIHILPHVIFSILTVVFLILSTVKIKTTKQYIIFFSLTLINILVLISFKIYETFSIAHMLTTWGIMANLVPLLIYIASLILFVIFIIHTIKMLPHRPTKTERLEQRITELEQQVDELKKGD